ncbi:MAG: hypothetical protein ACNYPE_13415 [Candidatus Azotimanducaceae bacterium WSBS_2022_MAG_OTU7]
MIAHTIARRVSRFLSVQVTYSADAESEYLDLVQDEEDAMGMIVCIITYRLASSQCCAQGADAATVPQNRQRKGDDLGKPASRLFAGRRYCL